MLREPSDREPDDFRWGRHLAGAALILLLLIVVLGFISPPARAQEMRQCSDHGTRITCVHDGDSFIVERERIRIADIDAPELNGHCSSESALALRARDRLITLLNSGPYQIQRQGQDRYGRTLGIVTNSRGSVGDQLVREGLARTWSGRREPWC